MNDMNKCLKFAITKCINIKILTYLSSGIRVKELSHALEGVGSVPRVDHKNKFLENSPPPTS